MVCHSEMRSVEESPTKCVYGMRFLTYVRNDICHHEMEKERESEHMRGMTLELGGDSSL